MKRVIVVAFIFAALAIAATGIARPNVHFCNTTIAPIYVVIATGDTVRARAAIPSDECTTPLAFAPDMHALYVYYAPNSQDTTWLESAPTRDFQMSDGGWRRFSQIFSGRDDATVVFMAPDAALIF